MAVQDAATLKGYFNTGDRPTESQFADLIDTVDSKQATLVSATNIKTINSTSLLGSGDITVGGADIPYQNDAPTSPSDGDLWIDKDESTAPSNSLVIFDGGVSANCTSWTISGLDINTDRTYLVRGLIYGATGSTSRNLKLHINSDSTSTNYYTAYAVGSDSQNTNDLRSSNFQYGYSFWGLIKKDNNAIFCEFFSRAGGLSTPSLSFVQYYGSDTNLTSLTFTDSSTNNIGTSTKVMIYKLA